MPMLLRQWAQDRATGTLIATAAGPEERVATVLVEHGGVVFATLRSRRDPTGDLFLEVFQVPELNPETADEVGFIQRQVSRVIVELFNWTTADAKFTDGINLSRWPKLPLSVGSLLLKGMRGVRDINRVLAWIGSLDQVFVTSANTLSLFDVDLTPDEAFFLTRLEDRVNLEEILAAEVLPRERAIRLVGALLFAGAIEPAEHVPVRQFVETPRPTVYSTPVIDPAEAAQFWYRVEEKLRSIERGADYYAVLEVDRRDSTAKITSSYEELAREFHPDRYQALAPAGINVEGQLDTIFDTMTTAFVVLTNDRYREIYDQHLTDSHAATAVRVKPPPARPRSVPVDQPWRIAPPAPPKPPTPAPDVAPPVDRTASPPSPAPRRPAADQPSAAPVVPAAPPAPPQRPIQLPTGQLSVSELIERGIVWADAGDHERAVRALERALVVEPKNPRLNMALGHSLAQISGHRRRAEEVLLRSTELSPFSIQPLLDLAALYFGAGRREDAKLLLKRAKGLRPNSQEVRDALDALAASERKGGSGLLKRLFQKSES